MPVVTGIGHEPDTTIADLVADLRCSTPTAAAEAVSPNEGYLDELLMRRAAQFEASLDRRIHAEGLRLKGLETRPLFKDPQALFSQRGWELITGRSVWVVLFLPTWRATPSPSAAPSNVCRVRRSLAASALNRSFRWRPLK